MPISVRFRFAAFLAVALFAGCSETKEEPKLAQISESCANAEQCAGGLTCAFAACHATCASTADCASRGGGLCVASDKTGRVCQSAAETSCTRSSDCAGVQICGADARCRDACAKSTDCASDQTCENGACAEAGSVVGTGGAGGAGDAGGAGGGAPTSCLRHSDCQSDSECVLGTCQRL